jgi:hypothetical protein
MRGVWPAGPGGVMDFGTGDGIGHPRRLASRAARVADNPAPRQPLTGRSHAST